MLLFFVPPYLMTLLSDRVSALFGWRCCTETVPLENRRHGQTVPGVSSAACGAEAAELLLPTRLATKTVGRTDNGLHDKILWPYSSVLSNQYCADPIDPSPIISYLPRIVAVRAKTVFDFEGPPSTYQRKCRRQSNPRLRFILK